MSRRAGDHLVGLARLAARLAQTTDAHEIIDIVTAEAAAAVGLEYVDIAFVRAGALVSTQVRWPLPGDIVERYAATPLDAHLPTTEAARTGRTVLVDDLLEYQADHPDLRADVVASGFRSAAVVPFRDAAGEVLGILGLVSRDRMTFDGPAAAAVEIAGELCGNALRRTELGERATALAHLATRLAGAASTVDVAEALRDLGCEPVSALHVNCRVVDSTGAALVSLVEGALPAAVAARYERMSLDDDAPLTVAARTGQPVWVADQLEMRARFPAMVADAETVGFQAVAAVPLHDSRGTVLGALALAWSSPVPFDALLRSSVMTIADLAAQAVERANRYDSEHELITTLQHRLLGTVVAPPGLEVATRYLPASRAVGIGGDWFDLITTGPSSFVLVIGDVTGHGVEAVVAMAQLRAVVNGLLRSGEPIDTLFDRADAMLDSPDRLLATVELFEVDVARSILRYTSAGHPWALRRSGSGAVELLDRAQQSLLGVPSRRGAPAEIAIEPGDVVVAYTDGLVERRGEPINVGIGRLVDRLAAAPDDVDADRLAGELLEASGIAPSSPVALDDDIALVVLRRL